MQELDLTSLDSIRTAAEELRSKHDTIDLLINNAGVMFTPKSTTKDGFELQFGTNHLGHFAFTGLLLDRVARGPRFPRGDRQQRGSPLRPERDPLRRPAVGTRTTAASARTGRPSWPTCLFTYELQRRLQGTNTIAAAAHPGGSRTELTRNLPTSVGAVTKLVEPLFQGADMGALPTLRAATDPGVIGGQYFGPDGFGEQRGYPEGRRV